MMRYLGDISGRGTATPSNMMSGPTSATVVGAKKKDDKSSKPGKVKEQIF
jgi:hypothetical protein